MVYDCCDDKLLAIALVLHLVVVAGRGHECQPLSQLVLHLVVIAGLALALVLHFAVPSTWLFLRSRLGWDSS